jgi:hypothetical protein
MSLENAMIVSILTIFCKNIKKIEIFVAVCWNFIIFASSIERLMTFESREVEGNGPEKSFAVCPVCGQKLFSVASLGGVTEIVAKCRRCRRFVKVRLVP